MNMISNILLYNKNIKKIYNKLETTTYFKKQETIDKINELSIVNINTGYYKDMYRYINPSMKIQVCIKLIEHISKYIDSIKADKPNMEIHSEVFELIKDSDLNIIDNLTKKKIQRYGKKRFDANSKHTTSITSNVSNDILVVTKNDLSKRLDIEIIDYQKLGIFEKSLDTNKIKNESMPIPKDVYKTSQNTIKDIEKLEQAMKSLLWNATKDKISKVNTPLGYVLSGIGVIGSLLLGKKAKMLVDSAKGKLHASKYSGYVLVGVGSSGIPMLTGKVKSVLIGDYNDKYRVFVNIVLFLVKTIYIEYTNVYKYFEIINKE